MDKPSLNEYVRIMLQLFEQFAQEQPCGRKSGRPYTVEEGTMVVVFVLFECHRLYQFKSQHRWLVAHPEILDLLEMERVPHRTTFSRRYKQLYETLQAFLAFLSEYATSLDERFSHAHLVEDKSEVPPKDRTLN